jgi:TetR/AcrR family transcriptional regulator
MARGEENTSLTSGAERRSTQGSRKDAILDEATRLFAERGYEGTSMADLAERVGLRKASLFHHFASKDQLRRAVLERLVQRVTSALATSSVAVDGGGEGFARSLDTLTDAVVGMLGEQPYAARLVVREAMEWAAGKNDAIGEALTESLRAGERFLRAAQQSGACVDGDPKQLVASLMGLHLLPFALGGVMERFTGQAPWTESFIAARRAAVRAQARALLLRK